MRFRRLKISHILMFSIGIAFVLGAALNIALVLGSLHRQSLREAEAKARILLDRTLAVHHYFSQVLKPRLLEWSAPFRDGDHFEPAWMSSTYANREIHRYFRSFNTEGYSIKDAAINARSPENEADDDEKAFLERLQRDATLQSHSALRTIDGEPFLAVMRRGETVEKPCLYCHSEPGDAPGRLVRLYGAERSFRRATGETISAISMRIPLAEAYREGSRMAVRLSALLALALAALLGLQWFVFRRFLISPLGMVRDRARAIAGSRERLGDEIPAPAGREFGELADAFNEMSRKLRVVMDGLEERVAERTAELRSANEALQREVARRERGEEAIRAALVEKETLLKEIHHRVKNNLQVVSSLLGLQAAHLPDERARRILAASQDRVRVMAGIHTLLYQSPDLARVDFGRFVRDLVGRLRQSCGAAEPQAEIRIEVEAMPLALEQAIPCGLIVNELVTNALRHAFADGRRGEIDVRIARSGGRIVLQVSDNGIGLPAAVDWTNPRTLGLELVGLLVEQIRGEIGVQSGRGTAFTITFPAEGRKDHEDGKEADPAG